MPIEMPGPERLPPGAMRNLTTRLHELYEAAGTPGVHKISRAVRDSGDVAIKDSVSHQSVSDMLHGNIKNWWKFEAVVRVLCNWAYTERNPDIEIEAFHKLWKVANRHSAVQGQEDDGQSESAPPIEATDGVLAAKDVTSEIAMPSPRISMILESGTTGSSPQATPRAMREAIRRASPGEDYDKLICDAKFLSSAPPAAVLGSLGRAESELARRIAQAYRASFGHHENVSIQERRQILAVETARHGAVSFAKELESLFLQDKISFELKWCSGSRVTNALQQVFAGHFISASAISAITIDNEAVAIIGDREGKVRIWNIRNADLIGTLPEPASHRNVNDLASIHGDGKPIAVVVSESGTVTFWNLQTRKRLEGTDFGTPVNAVACVRVGGIPVAVTGGDDYDLRLWNAATGELLASMAGHSEGIRAIACGHMSGSAVAISVALGDRAWIWDLDNRERIAPLSKESRWETNVVVVDVDDRLLAVTAGSRGMLRLWDLATESLVGTISADRHDVSALAACQLPGGPAIASLGHDHVVSLWDIRSGRKVAQLPGYTEWSGTLEFVLTDGRPILIAGGTEDGVARAWDLTLARDEVSEADHTDRVREVASAGTTDASYVVSGGEYGGVRVRSLEEGRALGSISGGYVSSLCCVGSIRGAVALIGGSGMPINVYSLDTRKSVRSFATPEGFVTLLRPFIHKNRQLVVVAGTNGVGDDDADGPVRIIDPISGEELLQYSGHAKTVTVADYAQIEGRGSIVSISSERMVIWDVDSGEEIWDVSLDDLEDVRCGRCLVTGEGPVIAFGTHYGAVEVWSLTRRTSLVKRHAHDRAITCMETLNSRPDCLFTGGEDCTLKAWRVQGLEEVGAICLPDPIYGMTSCPNHMIALALGWDTAVLELRIDQLGQ
jgi:WD40 repeat protein